MKTVKTLVNASMIAFTLCLSTVPRSHAAEISMITVGGIVATVAIYGIGYSGYGIGVGLLMSSGRNVAFKADDYRQALDVVATGDAALITPELAKILAEVRENEPKFADADDMALLESLVDAINKTI
jgi:hypothetical protein